MLYHKSMISLTICLNKMIILELLRIVFLGDENNFEIYSNYQNDYDDLCKKQINIAFLF